MSQIATETVVITPAVAKQLLATQKKNRPCDNHTVTHYARLMGEGKWEENGESIKLNAEGELIDGQHRLNGVIKSGVTLQMLLVKGVNGRAFETLDTGKTRSANDLLALQGFSQTSPLSAAARSLILYQRGMWTGTNSGAVLPTSPMEVVDAIKLNPDLVTAVAAAKGVYKEFARLWSPGYAAFLLTIARRQSPVKADQFFHETSTGEVNSTETLTFKLRQRLLQNAASRTHKLPKRAVSSICVKAWVAYRDDSDLERLRISDKEEFPEL